MKKNSLIALLAGMVLVLGTASCNREYKRETRIVRELLAPANAWLTNHNLAGKAACEVMFVNGDPQLNVVGIMAAEQQDAFVAAITGNPVRPSCIRFWSEKPEFSFIDVLMPEFSSVPREKLEAEAKNKLLRTVSLPLEPITK